MLQTMERVEQSARRGMDTALAHAEQIEVKWGDLALAFLHRHARKAKKFIASDVTEASKKWGLVQPPTTKAWGSVYRRAVKRGMIQSCGTVKSPTRHGSPTVLWASNVYREPS